RAEDAGVVAEARADDGGRGQREGDGPLGEGGAEGAGEGSVDLTDGTAEDDLLRVDEVEKPHRRAPHRLAGAGQQLDGGRVAGRGGGDDLGGTVALGRRRR